MKNNLFGKTIDPACQYCENGKLTKDGNLVLCNKKGGMKPYASCKSFDYAPLKRIPKRMAPLPQFDKKDFEI